MPSANAATRQRSISPWRGGGSASAVDDDQLIGVGDDHPLDRVVVVRGAAQHGAALVDRDDARQRALVARDVADDAYPVADDHALAPERPRLHRGDHACVVAVADQQRVATAVARRHERRQRVLVRGAVLGTGTGAAARPVVLRVLVPAAHRGQPLPLLGELRERLGRRRDVLDLDAGHGQPDHRAGVRHPVVGVGVPAAARAAAAARSAVRRPAPRPGRRAR